ncbi:DNA-protecting protein DprA [Rhodovastum atsumiense]|uniref:DNA-protecting protein DprA n=1 Tax=Rhodovastum atsumiense TaxID=504468 RepID=A0A5M6J340_9PROT|nr:DNA-processing protein DprA [Rhodovastum atsumiense]KAA5614659.1 DNA-protecting protein DprA [Rhodovastum atsumiense]CAH2599812.1 DNA-protecting protein DprA [Rhodovastum atsumiense]
MNEDLDRLRLARTEGVGPILYRRLLRRFGSAAAALEAVPGLARNGGRPTPPTVPSRAEAEREFDLAARARATLIFLGSPAYPPLLALLEDAPPVIAVQGHPTALTGRGIAIVGSRNASANGQRIAETMAEEMAREGLVVVSGLARGIDAAAHAGALRGGRTVACVAGGIDVPYPPEHAGLQARIAAGGAVVSEAPPGTAPLGRLFIRRNRVIAGLALGVVVVEAAQRSGALVTARRGLEAGREVFAVPGSPLDPRCRGANGLIRQGARLVETASDVLADLPCAPGEGLGLLPGFSCPDRLREPPPEPVATPPGDSAEVALARAQLADLLGPSPTSVDELIRRSHFSPAAVLGALLELEVAGRLQTFPGNMVALLAEPGH